MYDLLSIGGISVDLYFQSSSLTFKDNRFQLAVGGKYMAEKFHEGLGGGGANVAIGAKKNGLHTAVMGHIGNNVFKRIILHKLAEHDITSKHCTFENDYNNISTILLHPSGERSIIHYMTPHRHLINDKVDLQDIAKTGIVYMGNLPDIAVGERMELLKFFNKYGTETILNLGVKDCRRPVSQLTGLLSQTAVLIVNGHEFAELVKAPYKDIHFREQVIKWYIPELKEKLVVVTEGEKGSFAYLNDMVYHQPAVKIDKIVDTTGAGDGYTAGFIAEYFKSKDVVKSMKKGSLYASSILGKVGAN